MREERTHTESEVVFQGETDAAVQIITNQGEILWIPLSQVKSIERETNGTGAITMSWWIAQKKGLV